MATYDFFIAGRWRNRDAIKTVLDVVRDNGLRAYCFIDHHYVNTDMDLKQLESLPQNDPVVRKIFETDMAAQREAENFLLVLPAGTAGHIEAGVAYGMGKTCYAIGPQEKTETLYEIFERIFPDVDALQEWLASRSKEVLKKVLDARGKCDYDCNAFDGGRSLHISTSGRRGLL